MNKLIVSIFLLGTLFPGRGWAKDPIKPAKPSSEAATVFQCVPFNGNFATVAQRGDRKTPPMIEWTTTLGSEWTPERRCKEVSQRLTAAVATSGGKLRNLQLTYGPVKGERVICYIDATSRVNACNTRNILFTLRRADFGKEKAILETLVKFSLAGSGTHVQQSGLLYYATLGEAIEQSLENVKPSPNVGSSLPGI